MKLDVTKAMINAKEVMSDGVFQQVGSLLSDAKNIVREEAQKRTSLEIKEIINKLQSNAHISANEIAIIRAWIVGDAIGYTKMENSFQDWISEFERLTNALASYENKDCSWEDLLNLHGVLEDATRVTYDIAIFLEKSDRIKKFESAAGDGLDKNERDMLVNILTGKLQSPDY